MPAAPARRNILGRCVGFVHGASEVVAVACFFGLFVLIIVQVHYRYVLNNPLSWPEEVARNLFIWTVYLGLVKNFREDSHYRIDFLVNRLGRRVRHAILLGVDIASGVLFRSRPFTRSRRARRQFAHPDVDRPPRQPDLRIAAVCHSAHPARVDPLRWRATSASSCAPVVSRTAADTAGIG